MNIIEATKKALEENLAITNPETKEVGVVFIPTYSEHLGFLIVGTKPYSKQEEGVYKEKWLMPERYWNPRATDILRDYWELF